MKSQPLEPPSRWAQRRARDVRTRPHPTSSGAITRVQDLVRSAAALDGGVIFIAEPGTTVDSVAQGMTRAKPAGGGALRYR
jgi:hypothetical protein